jgi:hypothetical protein
MAMLTLSRSNLVCSSRAVISILIGTLKESPAGVPTTPNIQMNPRHSSVFDATLSSQMVEYSFWEILRIN